MLQVFKDIIDEDPKLRKLYEHNELFQQNMDMLDNAESAKYKMILIIAQCCESLQVLSDTISKLAVANVVNKTFIDILTHYKDKHADESVLNYDVIKEYEESLKKEDELNAESK